MTANAKPHRAVGAFALMLTGLGSIIGSGWLFGAARAASLAGPGAVWAWVIGAVVVMMIALTYAELGAMFPESGGMVRYSHYSHGSLVGFIGAWSNWIGIIAVIPVEATASVQYMQHWPWAWAHSLTAVAANGSVELTSLGLALAAALVVGYFLLNFWSVQLFAHSNTAITVFKLVVPATTGLLLIASGFHPANFSVPANNGGHAFDFPSILTAVTTAGIVFSFNGFQSPINLAGDARNPGRSIPFAVIGSIVLATVIYLILQVAYIGVMPSELLAKAGWHGVNFSSPFAELAILLGLQWLSVLLFTDAVISPSGTGVTYTATTARMIYGMERNGTLPKVFGRLHPKWGIPRAAMWLDLVVSMLFLINSRSWDSLAAVVGVAVVLSYLTGPVSAMVLRRTAPNIPRPLRVVGLPVIAGVAFIMATELLYWAKWPLTGKIILLIAVALPIYFYYQARSGWRDFARQLHGAWWLIAYLPTIAVLSWAGGTAFGGKGYLPNNWDLLIIAVVGLVFFVWGVKSGWSTPSMQEAEQEILSGLG